MPGPPTPNLGLTVPTVGGDPNTWGNELNGDLAILDGLGVVPSSAQSTNFSAAVSLIAPEIVYRVTTGSSVLTATLPAPSTCAGRIVNVKKIDAGVGSITINATPSTIDGNNNYVLAAQYQFVRLYSNGTTWDVIAYG